MKKKIHPVADYCRIEKKEKTEKIKKSKRKYKKVKNNIVIPRVISNYKNPSNKIVSLEARQPLHDIEIINYNKFIEFNKFLDKIEEHCKNENKSLR